METFWLYRRLFKTKKAAKSFVSAYCLTDYEIINTTYERIYQGRMAKSQQFSVFYNEQPLTPKTAV
jgi:hypothetical protein